MTSTPGLSFVSMPTDARRSSAEHSAVIAGLTAEVPWVSPKYLYSPLGSRLFDAITELPEYYPTRTERALLDARRCDIASAAGLAPTLIDLGAGNCEKASSLFHSLEPRQYVGVDISIDFLRQAMSQLQRQFPHIDMLGIEADFTAGLDLPDAVGRENRLFFYPGSSIGNFTPDQALAFLSRVRANCPRGGLLIGVDLVKPIEFLEAAYDDELGVTAAFNLNLLNNLNELLGSDFALADWKHRATFNSAQSRVEMHLEATRDTLVRWPGGSRAFHRGQHIHTESSYKYTLDGFNALLEQAGFARVDAWTDANDWFALCYAHA